MNKKRQRLFRYAVDTLIELLEQITKKKHPLKCNDTDVKSFDAFMDYFGDAIGEDFIRKFLEYGMQSWFNEGSDIDYSRRVRISWIFGASAIKRWNMCSMETNVFMTRAGIKIRHRINVIKKNSKINELVVTLIQREEKQKALHLNTDRGFLWCIATTTLYFHKSSFCVMCSNKNECKLLLKQEYNKVYIKRGYGE